MARPRPPKHAVDPIRSLGKVASFASFGLFVIIVINYVDAHHRYTTELENQQSLVAQDCEQRTRLEQYQAESDRMNAQLVEFDKRAIVEAELAEVQDQLLGLAKEHGCTIKKASPRGKIVRDFNDRASHLSEAEQTIPSETSFQANKQYEIHDACLALSIEGDLKPTMAFLNAVKQLPWLVSTRQLVLRRDPNQSSYLATELELQFSSLHESPNRSAGELPPRS